MISYRFTVENLWNGLSIVLNDTETDPDNYYGIEESPINELAVRTEERNIAGRHGVKSYFSFYGGRALSFQGKIVAQSAAMMETMEQNLRQVFALPSLPSSTVDGFVRISWTDNNGDDWQVLAKVSSGILTKDYLGLKRVRDYLVQLRTESSIIQRATTNSTTLFRFWTQGTLHLPTKLPLQLAVISFNEATVTVGGNYDSPPIITIYGPASGAIEVINPRISHVEKNKFIEVTTTLGIGDVLVIDVENGTIILNGTTDLSSLLSTNSEYFYLSPGTNTLRFTHEDQTPDQSGVQPTEYSVLERRDAVI